MRKLQSHDLVPSEGEIAKLYGADFNKPGFEFVRPLPSHQLYEPIVTDMKRVNGKRFLLRLRMPVQAYELYGAPKELELVYDFEHEGTVDVSLQWFGKEANRLPEASWFGCALNVDNPNLWLMDKMGLPVSPLRVVKDGNRNLHAIGRGVSYQGQMGAPLSKPWMLRWLHRVKKDCYNSIILLFL